MPMAWIEDDKIRDICLGRLPSECYHPDVAKFYSVQVPDEAKPGMKLIDGVWQFEIVDIPVETAP